MPRLLTCPHGHQWQAPDRKHGGSTELQAVCPVCGTLVDVLAMQEAVSAETVDRADAVAVEKSGRTPVDAALVTGDFPAASAANGLPVTIDPGATSDDAPSEPPAESAPAPRAGQPMVAGYEILGELGRGGMGVVYKARQTKLNRLVALKMILAGAHAGQRQFERFRIEAEAVARLQHANIVQIHEIGEQDGLPFFSLEFVDGGSLADKLAGTPLPPRQAAGLTAALARAMEAAHQRDIIHRDLKPANVLLTRDGAPKITDFGLAKKLDEAEGQTHTGAIMGTPSYMAPEQAEGKTRLIGPAADIYALGAILYETLIGRPPFKAATLVDTLVQVRTQEPVAPRQLLGNLPRDLETICLKCLDKEPARRYASAGALADDLDRWLAGLPIQARPTPLWERAWKWAKRRPALSAMTVLLAVVSVVGFALVTWQWRRAETERDKAARLADSESEAKHAVEEQKDVADARRRDAQRMATRLLMERGVGLCEQGKYGPGLLWLARGLEATPEDAGDQRHSLRALLGGWSAQLCQMKVVMPHPPRVLSAALSPDGKTVVTGGWDKTARLWEAATGRPIGQPLRHPGVVYNVAFSPDGKTVLTLCGDNISRLWRVDSGALRGELPRHPSRVLAAVFSPDGKRVLTGCRDRNARLWDLATGKMVGPLMPHGHEVLAVDFSLDGKRLVTGSRDKTARLWETATGKPAGPPLKHPQEVFAVALAPDGKSVLTGCRDRAARLWDGLTGQTRGEPLPHLGPVSVVAFSPDGRTLLTGSEDRTCCLWDAATGRQVGEAIRHQGTVSTALFAADGRTILTSSIDGTARLWNAAGVRPAHESRWHPGEIHSVVFSPDGGTILTAGADKTARLWDAVTAAPRGEPLVHQFNINEIGFRSDGTLVLTRSGSLGQLWDARTGKRRGDPLRHDAVINSAVFSPDGRLVLTASADQTARLWRTDDGRPQSPPIQHNGMVTTAAFHPDGKLLVTSSVDGTAQLRRIDSGELLRSLQHGGPLIAAAFSPKGDVVLTRSGNAIRLWEIPSGRPIGQPVRHGGALHAAVFSPDGKFVVTAGSDKTAQLVDVSTGKPVGAPRLHESAVVEAVFSSDGELFATRSGNAVRLWKTATGEPIGEALRHPQLIQAMVFSPDGKVLLTGSQDGSARLWDAATGQPLGKAFPHPEAISALAIHPNGRMFAVGAKGWVRLWDLPSPLEGGEEPIKRWLQVNTGLELDPGGTAVALDGPSWQRIRERLDAANH